jgi:DNA-binding NtrC family response regulator
VKGGAYFTRKRALLDEFEAAYLEEITQDAAGNLSVMSRASGLSRRQLRSLLRKHGLWARVLDDRIEQLRGQAREVGQVAT